MNKLILMATALVAGTGAIVYLVKRKRKVEEVESVVWPVHHSRHATEVFAKAKH